MKIRTDFVTNSSSSSFITVKTDDNVLAAALGYESSDQLNRAINRAIGKWYDYMEYHPPFEKMIGLKGLLLLLSINEPSIKEYLEDAYEDCCQEWEIDKSIDIDDRFAPYRELADDVGKDILSRYSQKQPSSFPVRITEGSIGALTFDLGFHDDGDFGPFIYARYNNGKLLKIMAEYKNYPTEDIAGYEFLLTGALGEYEDFKGIVRYIQKNGGTITGTLTDRTRYAVYPLKRIPYEQPGIPQKEIESIRKQCVPLLSEPAFAYRWLGGPLGEDVKEPLHTFQVSLEIKYNDSDFLSWFERYGFGETSILFWQDGQWRERKD